MALACSVLGSPTGGSALVILLLLVSNIGVPAQRHEDAFREGMKAFDQERWAEAAQQFDLASRGGPDSDKRVRLYGLRHEIFLPRYFLGHALFKAGDLKGAIRAFDASEQSGAVKGNRTYYQRLQDLRRDARRTLQSNDVPTGPPSGPRETPVTNPPTVSPPVNSPRPSPPSSPTPAPRPEPDVRVEPVGGAEPAVRAEPVVAAEQAVQRARHERQALAGLLDLDVLRQIDPRLRQAEHAAQQALKEAEAYLETGRQGNAAALERAAASGVSAETGFRKAHGTAEAASRRAIGDLTKATQLYFDGKYGAARTALARLDYPAGRFAIQLRLFRAAAAYALYALSGNRDETLRREAVMSVLDCRRMAARNFRPDGRAFSPKFIEFFEATR
jgi:hypothetical protein